MFTIIRKQLEDYNNFNTKNGVYYIYSAYFHDNLSLVCSLLVYVNYSYI